MSKQKDHLFYPADLVRSVLRGEAITAECGMTRVVSRESVDDTSYRSACKHCMAKALAGGAQITISPKLGWVALLESVWTAEHPAPVKTPWKSTSVSAAWTETHDNR